MLAQGQLPWSWNTKLSINQTSTSAYTLPFTERPHGLLAFPSPLFSPLPKILFVHSWPHCFLLFTFQVCTQTSLHHILADIAPPLNTLTPHLYYGISSYPILLPLCSTLKSGYIKPNFFLICLIGFKVNSMKVRSLNIIFTPITAVPKIMPHEYGSTTKTNKRTKNIVNGKWMNWGKSSFLRKNLWSNCRVSSIPKGSWNKEEGGEEETEEEERLHIAASDTSFGRILFIYWEGSSQIPVSKSFRKETRRLKSGYRSDRSICTL